MKKKIPGTIRYYQSEDAFIEFKKAIELTDGLSLGQVCSITGLEPMVIQNWVKRGYVAHPVDKKYHEKQFARILLVNALRGAMRIDEIGKLMTLVNGDVEDESDDLLKEEDLYTLFSKVVYFLDENQIEKTVSIVMGKENYTNHKLNIALEVMVHAYIATEQQKKAKEYMKELEKY